MRVSPLSAPDGHLSCVGMARCNYTTEQRTEALKVYAEAGPAEASRRTGIKRATISKWASRHGVSSDRAERTRRATEADIYPGPESSEPLELTNVAGTLFFSATDPTHGRELWKTVP
jgi:hypothetical protein